MLTPWVVLVVWVKVERECVCTLYKEDGSGFKVINLIKINYVFIYSLIY